MPVGAFPALTTIQQIKEFDRSSGKLSDFITSVDGHMAAYNFPLSQGGYVAGNVEDGWMYATTSAHNASPSDSKSNYPYGTRFVLLLAERLSGPAREW